MARLAVTAPFGFTFDPPRLLKAYRALGVQTAQFYRNEKAPPTVAEALRASDAAAVPYDSIHGLFGPHLDPTSPDAAHRDHCLRVYEDEGRLARDLGGPMVVVHPAAQTPDLKPLPRDFLDAQVPIRMPLLDQWMRRLAEIGARLGVVYLIENQPLNCELGHDPVVLARAIAAVNSPFIRMCFDSGHAHITGDAAGALRACAPVIAYLHLHDNDAILDDHRMPGDGNLPWAEFAHALRAADLSAPRMLEVFPTEERVEQLAREGFAKRLSAMCDADLSVEQAA
ncbi:hypothetical protein BH11PLA1_BH11PLA1_06290 [soil metagenome]